MIIVSSRLKVQEKEEGARGGGEERECHLVPFRHWEERVFSGEHSAADEDAGKDDVHEVGVVDDMMTEHSHSVTGKSNGLHTPKQRKVVTPRQERRPRRGVYARNNENQLQ